MFAGLLGLNVYPVIWLSLNGLRLIRTILLKKFGLSNNCRYLNWQKYLITVLFAKKRLFYAHKEDKAKCKKYGYDASQATQDKCRDGQANISLGY